MIELLPFMLFCFYIIPFCVAAGRGHPSATAILVLNLSLGWTVVGWFAVLAWAALSPAEEY